MVQQTQQATRGRLPYDRWMESQDIPIYHDHSVDDPMALELGEWRERECNACFIQLEGQQCVSEARITEIAPGGYYRP